MKTHLVVLLIASGMLVNACTDSEDKGLSPSADCDRYLRCISGAQPQAFAVALDTYGADSPCWRNASTSSLCEQACRDSFSQLSKLYPDKPECGGSAKDGGAGDGAVNPVCPKTGKEVDILFVVDKSDSMEWEQKTLSKDFGTFIEALRSSKLGNKIPNLHLGVVSVDLGAGSQTTIPGCLPGGDQGKLQSTTMIAGCTPPSNPWIEYKDGKTNIPGSGTDPVQDVKDAFSCIAELGTGGCGFEHQLEAARTALDSAQNKNPGFLRADALLAVLFLTDEDDCSASKSSLFDPTQQSIDSTLGPLTSFRCFEFGVTCSCPGGGTCDRKTTGTRINCVPEPTGKYLHPLSRYISFFKSIKKTTSGAPDPGRVILAAIAGPTSPVIVDLNGANPALSYSCTTSGAQAVPAIRIKALVDAFGINGQFSSICASFSDALTKLAKMIKDCQGN